MISTKITTILFSALLALLVAGSRAEANIGAQSKAAAHYHFHGGGLLSKKTESTDVKLLVQLPHQVILPIEHWIGFPALTVCERAHKSRTPLAWKKDRIVHRTKVHVAKAGNHAAKMWTDPNDPCHQALPYYEAYFEQNLGWLNFMWEEKTQTAYYCMSTANDAPVNDAGIMMPCSDYFDK